MCIAVCMCNVGATECTIPSDQVVYIAAVEK